jgi:hypothetical protein
MIYVAPFPHSIIKLIYNYYSLRKNCVTGLFQFNIFLRRPTTLEPPAVGSLSLNSKWDRIGERQFRDNFRKCALTMSDSGLVHRVETYGSQERWNGAGVTQRRFCNDVLRIPRSGGKRFVELGVCNRQQDVLRQLPALAVSRRVINTKTNATVKLKQLSVRTLYDHK